MTADLESSHRKGGFENHRSRFPKFGDSEDGAADDHTISGNKTELNYCQRDGVSERGHDGFAGIGRQGRREVP